MENILLWASVVSGVLVFVSAFLTRREPDSASPGENWAIPPALRWTAILLPLLGLMVTLPASGAFSAGQGLGRGFFLGGAAALLAFLPLLRGGRLGGRDLLAGPFGMGAAAVALPLLLLRASLLDALMGVAVGWFAVAFTLYLGQSPKGREQSGAAVAAATGFTLTLCAGAVIGTLRAPAAGMTNSTGWSASLVAFGTAVCGIVPACGGRGGTNLDAASRDDRRGRADAVSTLREGRF
jgi:hypothetical protein